MGLAFGWEPRVAPVGKTVHVGARNEDAVGGSVAAKQPIGNESAHALL